ncbi:unnamed protein product [Caenorhabditis bovis]|uniref:Tubulin--tyrosine ligase-like protein 9 n=1 Tax=Caenorhabditis bovis TaxID=2654633 RepID=A0A8S1EH23_9PELO|nr:unnamed protein product [Caenorhabditis bovis]
MSQEVAHNKEVKSKKKILFKCALTNTISDVLTNREGWAPTQSDDWQFFWVTREWMTTSYDKHKFGEKQLICHFRNDFELTRKDFLIKNYKKARKAKEKSGIDVNATFNFLPSSYVLPAEYHLFVEEFRKYPSDTIWIMKPVAGAQGKGIFLFRKLKHIQEWKKKDSSGSEALPYVVQNYISNPYLIGGKKFDVRLYVLVTSFRPLTAWVHREGFARFSHSRYSTDNVDDAFVHLTNVAIAKTASDYDPERGLKWSLPKLFRFFKAIHGCSKVAKMLQDLATVIIESLKCVQNLIIQDNHCFELYGYDILFDANLKPWLLEVNASPSLTASSQEDFDLKYRVLNHMLDVLDLENNRTGNETSIGGFDILIKNNKPVEKCQVDEHNGAQFVPTLNLRLARRWCLIVTMRIVFLLVLVGSVLPENYFDSSEEAPDIQLQHLDDIGVNDEKEKNETKQSYVPGSSKRLTEYLLSKHNPNAPPDGLLNVEYELELVHILGIDELKQTMTVLIYVDEHWNDPSLVWDPALFGGITKTWMPVDKIWIPDIIIFNMLAHEDLLSAIRAPVRIHYNGTVVASHPAVHTVSCEINIRHFPLDDQRCAIEIASWSYGHEKIRLHAHTDHSLQHYKRNEEWHLLHLNVTEEKYEHEGVEVSEVKFELSVKRRPLFYMVTLTFPSYIMCAISVVGLFARFSTTGEREERFTLGVTAILTMAVLSLVVSEKVPHSSTHVPLLVAYFLFNMVIVSLAAMTTGIVMKVHRMGRYGDEPPECWMKFFCLRPIKLKPYRRKYLMKGDEPEQVVLVAERKNGENSTTTNRAESITVITEEPPLNARIAALETYMKKMVNRCENIQCELDEMDNDQMVDVIRRRSTNGYVRISERLDLCFMFFFLTVVTVPVIILFYLS